MLNEYFMNKYQLSRKGSNDLIKSILSVAVHNTVIMAAIGMIFFFFTDALKYLSNSESTNIDLLPYAIMFVIITVALAASYWIQYTTTFVTAYSESSTIRLNLAERFRKLPLSYYSNKDPSDLTTIMMDDVAFTETALSHFIPELYGSVLSIIFVCIGLMFFDWRMTLAVLATLPISLIFIYMGKKKIKGIDKATRLSKLTDADSIQECLDTISEVKSCARSDYFKEKLSSGLKKTEQLTFKGELTVGLFVSAGKIVLQLGIPATLLVGIELLTNSTLDLLTFIMYLFIIARLYDPISVCYENIMAVYITDLKIKPLKELNSIKIQTGTKKPEYKNMDIEFDNVVFNYDNGENVLDGVSFIAKQGEITALVGPSGCGKSTASKLASRFWDCSDGKITLGGQDITHIDPEILLKEYSIVFQDVVLFSGSIMDNIRIGKLNATDEEVLEAARVARCDIFVQNLPDGYNTDVGENGVRLSGGERQRISIARAVLKDSPIIIMDEATASLDSDNETHIQNALSELIENKTVLVIAHRMRTIANADKIIVMEKGQVVQTGAPAELLKQEGAFKKMVDLQNRNITLI